MKWSEAFDLPDNHDIERRRARCLEVARGPNVQSSTCPHPVPRAAIWVLRLAKTIASGRAPVVAAKNRQTPGSLWGKEMLKAVVGLQFGDEGKGKFTDLLSRDTDHIVRFNGGANAGHTVQTGATRAAFSQLPASLAAKQLYIGQGTLLSPPILIKEIEYLAEQGIQSTIKIDPRCHIVLPIHAALNRASEKFKGDRRIGSVGVGVGACFEDKANRHGIRLHDLMSKEVLRDRLNLLWQIRERQIREVFLDDFELDMVSMLDEAYEWGQYLKPYLSFINEDLRGVLALGEGVLLEAAHATFLDNSFGSYPYTVAYQTLVQSALPGIGLAAQPIDVLGVLKAYSIRVGNGPFPTEIDSGEADYIRQRGNEYGTVSKRPRRCGWLDLNLVKHAVKLNGADSVAITNVDVLAGLSTVHVATAYSVNGTDICGNRALLELERVIPEYRSFEGWPELRGSYSTVAAFPDNLQRYLRFIESYLEVPIRYVSYGPDRDQTLCTSSFSAIANDAIRDRVHVLG